MKTFKEYQDLAKNTDTDLNQLVNDLIEGCQTHDDIFKRFNEFTQVIGNYNAFVWIEKDGKKVLKVDISQGGLEMFGKRQAAFGLYVLINYFEKLSKDTNINVVYNLKNLGLDSEVLKIAPKLLKTTNSFASHRAAMYGLSTLQRIVVKAFVNKDIIIANSEEEALEWVVKD